MNPVTEPVKITSLELENVKRIRACAITPTQNGLMDLYGQYWTAWDGPPEEGK